MADEQNVNPGVTPDPVVTQPAPATSPVAQPLPDAAPDRTKEQFDKLLDSNKRLIESNEILRREMEQRRQMNDVFNPIQKTPVPQGPVTQPQVNPQDFVERDPISGEEYINESKLRAKLDELNSKATRAEQAIQNYIQASEQREIERQNQEAFQAFPELDPQGKNFDSKFHNVVRGVLYDSMLNVDEYGGKPMSFKEAAAFVKSQTQGNVQPVAAPAAPEQQPNEAQELKEQGSAQANSQPMPARSAISDDEDLARLQMRTRLGDEEALAQRILNTDHVQKGE